MREKKRPPKDDEMLSAVEKFTETVQKNSKKIILTACSLFFLIAILGLAIDRHSKPRTASDQNPAENPETVGTAPEEPKPLTISQTAVSIEAGKTVYLSVSNNTEAVVWMSSDPAIAAVSEGTVTGLAVGSAVITAASGDETVTCMVTITDPDIDPSIIVKLNRNDITIRSQDPPAQLKVKISGTKEAYTGKITWSSSDTNVAVVSDTGLVERISRGSATITAEANGQVLECLVRVP